MPVGVGAERARLARDGEAPRDDGVGDRAGAVLVLGHAQHRAGTACDGARHAHRFLEQLGQAAPRCVGRRSACATVSRPLSASVRRERRVAVQAQQRVGERLGVLGLDEQAVDLVLDELGDAGHRAGDHGRAGGHRLDEHVGDAVAVVGEEAAGHAQRARAAVLAQQLLLAHRRRGAGHGRAARGARSAPGSRPSACPPGRRSRLERDAAAAEDGAGVDEDVEALLGDVAADGEDAEVAVGGRRAVGLAQQPGEVGVEPVVDEVDLRLRARSRADGGRSPPCR